MIEKNFPRKQIKYMKKICFTPSFITNTFTEVNLLLFGNYTCCQRYQPKIIASTLKNKQQKQACFH